MPQMAPINWMLLFNIFILSFIMLNIMNYFNFFYYPNKILFKKTFINLNWKW